MSKHNKMTQFHKNDETIKNPVEALQLQYLPAIFECFTVMENHPEKSDHPSYGDTYKEQIQKIWAIGKTEDNKDTVRASLNILSIKTFSDLTEADNHKLKPADKEFLTERLSPQNMGQFYNLYTDIMIDLRRTSVKDGTFEKSDFMTQSSASPSIEAYEYRNSNGQTRQEERDMYKSWEKRHVPFSSLNI